MKKFFLGIVAVSMLAMTSCNTDVDDSTSSMAYATLNYVTPIDGQSTPFITDAAYKYFFNLSKGRASVAMDGLSIDNVKYSFSTDTVPFSQTAYQVNNSIAFVNRITNVKGDVNKDSLLPLSSFNCEMTGLFYWPRNVIPGIDAPTILSNDGTMIIMQYNIGREYNIKTVQPDAFFCGTTHTTVSGAQPFESNDMAYRVKLNKGFKTADIIIYNAKFSDKMPKPLTAVVLKDLNIKFGSGTYSIEGTDIIPFVPESGALTEYKNYPFERFSLVITDGALTQANISYKVNLHLEKDGQEVVLPAEGYVNGASYLIKVQSGN